MLTFAVEMLRDCLPEMKGLLAQHWEEIGSTKDVMVLDPSYEEYLALEALGHTHVVIGRSAGRMIGYHVSFVRPHLHYRNTLSAIVDIYYVHPDFRGGAGYRLFRFVDASLKQRGVKAIFTACKLKKDIGPLLERLGYVEHERLYKKVIA